MANKYTLHGAGVKVEYTRGGNPSFPSFHYTHGSTSKSFKLDQIHTDTTEIGDMVTVALETLVDSGGTTFSVLLPTVNVAGGAKAEVSTFAVDRITSGPIVQPLHQHVSYRTVHLRGTAEEVIVPLATAASPAAAPAA